MVHRELIYFICTGNSCRSQMAEGFARHWVDQRYEVLSGGLSPSFVHPLAIRVMAEVGIDISHQTSDPIDLKRLRESKVAITLCGDAEEACPATPPQVRRDHWPLRDPARATGSEEEVLQVFRDVRDEIAGRVKKLLEELG
ncbi:MAG: arsenate reductase (thioredoxin) [Bacillota bacterium]|nr:arsenate reductase (thioredoxin) [Bacillota bacterium]